MPLPKIVRTIFSPWHLTLENQSLKQLISGQHVESDCYSVFLHSGGKWGATSGAWREGKIIIQASLVQIAEYVCLSAILRS